MTHTNAIRRPPVNETSSDGIWHLFCDEGHVQSFGSKLSAKLFADAIVLSHGMKPERLKLWSDEERAWILIGHLLPLDKK